MTTVTDVRPLVSVVTYTDEETGSEIYQEVLGRTFMPLDKAPEGAANASKLPPVMQTRGSRFVKFQEARIQELATEVRHCWRLRVHGAGSCSFYRLLCRTGHRFRFFLASHSGKTSNCGCGCIVLIGLP